MTTHETPAETPEAKDNAQANEASLRATARKYRTMASEPGVSAETRANYLDAACFAASAADSERIEGMLRVMRAKKAGSR